VISAIILILVPLTGAGQGVGPDTAPQHASNELLLSAQFDNDLFASSDQDYSSGSRIAISGGLKAGPGLFLETIVKGLGAIHLPLERNSGDPYDNHYSWAFGATSLIFTPNSIVSPIPPPGQRPYAGWLGLEASVQHLSDHRMSTLTLIVGVTGDASQAEELQDWVHEYLSENAQYRGWDSQVPEELTLALVYDRKNHFSLTDMGERWGLESDSFLEWGFSLGNYRTDAYIGGTFRFGLGLPGHYLVPRIEPGLLVNKVSPEVSPEGDWSLFGFAGLKGISVLHDITLDGPLFRDFAYAVESRPLVGEMITGIGVRFKRLQLLFSHTMRTEEFENQTDNHEYGSITALYQF